MKKLFVILVGVVAVVLVGAFQANATVAQDGLLFEVDANNDSDPSDGWDYTSVVASGGTLPLLESPWGHLGAPVGVPSRAVHPGGQAYFSHDGNNNAYAGPVGPKNITSWTYELWMERLGDGIAEGHLGSFRMDTHPNNFSGNAFNISGYGAGGADPAILDFDTYDRGGAFGGSREKHGDAAPSPLNEWQQIVVTYQDATGEGTDDGVLSVYINGSSTPVYEHVNGKQCMSCHGTADLGQVQIWNINGAETRRTPPSNIAINRIYNRVLSAQEIAGNFDAAKSGLGIPEPSTVALLGLGLPLMLVARRRRG